jgi:20S proteasome subunit beta 3
LRPRLGEGNGHAAIFCLTNPLITSPLPPFPLPPLPSFGPYFIEPVVAGLDKENKPYITAMDLIGAPVVTDDFVVAGTSSENLYGMAEGMYRKDMGPEELFETISQVLLASVDRDALAGWGGVVHIITPEGVYERELKGRQD